jgi:hypothetical protein
MAKGPQELELDRLVKIFPILRSRLKIAANGCLEYIGPQVGRVEGNPIVYTPDGNILLRRLIGVHHYRTKRKKLFFNMTCGNHRCLYFKHMEVSSKKKTFYRHRKLIPGHRLTREEKLSIQYYGKRIPTHVWCQVLDVSEDCVRNVRDRALPRYQLPIPKNFRPPKQIVLRLSRLTASDRILVPILDPCDLETALEDLRHVSLLQHEKDILRRSLRGERMSTISEKKDMDRRYVYFCRKRALIKIWQSVGPRKWILEASKGRIRNWVQARELGNRLAEEEARWNSRSS